MQNSQRLIELKKSTKNLLDMTTIEETQEQLEYIGKLQRLKKRNKERQALIDKMMK